jgi:outer membrane lipoprotein-sorting protein
MIRQLLCGLALVALAVPAHAAFGVGELMAELATHPGGRAKFVEKRYLAVLDRPVVATGEMAYTAPDRLEKRTLTPKPETMVLDGDLLSLERDRRKLSINLANRPEALAFVDSIRNTLAGNQTALERNYTMQVSGDEANWVLTLSPIERKIAALIQRITVAGSRNRIRTIEYLLADGDRSELSIEPLEAP